MAIYNIFSQVEIDKLVFNLVIKVKKKTIKIEYICKIKTF